MEPFDDSGPAANAEDFTLLSTGHVHLVRHDWARARLLSDLAALGYPVAAVDLGTCADARAVRAALIAAVPGWPQGYGAGNWDAFADAQSDHLLDAAHPRRVVVLDGFDAFRARDPDGARVLAGILADAGRWHLLFGRRLICLLVTDDPHLDVDLGPLGGHPANWNRYEWLTAHRDGTGVPPWVDRS